MGESTKAAVILAAGEGKRMGKLGELMPKSMITIPGLFKCTLEVNIDNLLKIGTDLIVIIVGYKSDMINSFIKSRYPDKNIICVYNPYYSEYGCEYSVSSSYMVLSSLTSSDSLIILEADTIIAKDYLEQLYSNSIDNFRILSRKSSFIDDTKSVIIATSDECTGRINKFCYDPTHSSVRNHVPRDYLVVGESMQVWYLSGNCLTYFLNLCKNYLCESHKNDSIKYESGLYNLNKVADKFMCYPVYVDGTKWFNFNKEEDLYQGGNVLWALE